MTVILGISAFYHDSAAVLLIDGKLVAAAQEERFTRQKHDASFPRHAIGYVLQEAGIKGEKVTHVAFHEKPFIKFERLLETYHVFAPKGFRSFVKAIPLWIKEKLYIKKSLRENLQQWGIRAAIFFPEHHLSHAASAFYPSPYREAAILTVDGVGEWATTTISKGYGNTITQLRELQFPHSLGLLYSAFTYYCGFKVNSGEYKLMGLAPYGNNSPMAQEYISKIKTHLIDIRDDGSFLLNMDYFNYTTGLTMTNSSAWQRLFGIPPRQPECEISQPYIDMAYAIQFVTEEVMLKLIVTAHTITGVDHLVLAGGVALNCVANGKIRKNNIFKDIWIQPAAGDAGGAIGAAFAVWHIVLGKGRAEIKTDLMSGTYLGPAFTDNDAENLIRKTGADAKYLPQEDLYQQTASLLSNGAIVGWFQGRMEFGPRALGNRSILADPRNTDMQRKLNLEIKNRESFRPFAPSVLEEDNRKYFETDALSPYMLIVDQVNPNQLTPLPKTYNNMPYMEKLYTVRSSLQAITHVDFSARVQTVSEQTNPVYYKLLQAFKQKTGCSILVNTSFNVRGEPIVCTPEDAYRCFINTGMDYLVIGNYLFKKKNNRNNIQLQIKKT